MLYILFTIQSDKQNKEISIKFKFFAVELCILSSKYSRGGNFLLN